MSLVLVGVDATGALMALLLSPNPQQRLQQAALALLLTKPLLPSVTAASTRAVSLSCCDMLLVATACHTLWLSPVGACALKANVGHASAYWSGMLKIGRFVATALNGSTSPFDHE